MFWVAFTIVAIACAVLARWLFPLAFPIVSLDIAMNREAALASAEDLARTHGYGPTRDVRAVATFSVDSETQMFVELEAGGAEMFARLLDDPLYSPYSWRVRRFRAGDSNETTIWFRPDGTPMGFRETVGEDEPRSSLDPDAALALAAAQARDVWRIEIDKLTLVESGQDRKPNGRVDHHFVYQRDEGLLGGDRHRLSVAVSGDRVSEVVPEIRVPESFRRRYAEMRSANTGYAAIGTGGAALYLFVGCGVGLFVLTRRHAAIWRPALIIAAVIAIAGVLADLNSWPLLWLGYDTALPVGNFVFRSLLSIAGSGLVLGIVMAFSIAAAEGLSRLAFAHHPRLWWTWRRDAASSPEIGGRTAAGYLLVPLQLTYVMLLFLVTSRNWGWWNPSDTLVNPDSLAHYAPWFSPFAMALQAGVWEECLFRAVPLAGAALLGARFGHRTLFIAIAFVLQVIVFGAAHASYPAQPAYARLLELMVPSTLFGLLYLRYGLLPGIVLHFVYDIVLMSLPLFATESSGIWVDRGLLIALALLPLFIIMVRRVQTGRWAALPEALRNIGWRAAPVAVVTSEGDAEMQRSPGVLPRGLLPGLAIGCALIVPTSHWLQQRAQPAVPVLEITRVQAERIAREMLDRRGVVLAEGTRALVSVNGSPSAMDSFVWRSGGKELYESLIGTWLHPPRYLVRFARFEGDVAARADEWIVTVTRDGVVRTVRHLVPEDAVGADLAEPRARELALAALERELGIAPTSMREVSVEPRKQPARTDWAFTFADATGRELPQGELRARVDIAGDEVIGAVPLVHIPEEWQRNDRVLASARRIVTASLTALTFGPLLVGAVAGVGAWSRRRFSVPGFLTTAAMALLLGAATVGNGWLVTVAGFSTAQTLAVQYGVGLLGRVFAVLLLAAGMGLIVGLVMSWRRAQSNAPIGTLVAVAALLGIVLRNLQPLLLPFGTLVPPWPRTAAAASLVPLLEPAIDTLTHGGLRVVMLLLVLGFIGRLSGEGSRRKAFATALLLVFGAGLFGGPASASMIGWGCSLALGGFALAAAYWLLFRFDRSVVPITVAAGEMFGLIPLFAEPYPGATAGAALAAVTLAAIAWWAFRVLRRAPA